MKVIFEYEDNEQYVYRLTQIQADALIVFMEDEMEVQGTRVPTTDAPEMLDTDDSGDICGLLKRVAMAQIKPPLLKISEK